jgi:hypothetical protein
MEAGIVSALNGVGMRAEIGEAASRKALILNLSMPKKSKFFGPGCGYFLA